VNWVFRSQAGECRVRIAHYCGIGWIVCQLIDAHGESSLLSYTRTEPRKDQFKLLSKNDVARPVLESPTFQSTHMRQKDDFVRKKPVVNHAKFVNRNARADQVAEILCKFALFSPVPHLSLFVE
jgi:hypothetical protein